MRAWLLALALLTAGCRASADRPRATTTTVLPSTTTPSVEPTSTTDASFRAPAVVDLPYVQRVLETIYHLDGEATRRAYATRALDGEVDQRLRAIFGGPALAEARSVLTQNAARGFAVFADPPGDATVHARNVVQATARCLIVQADLDFSPTFRDPQPRPPSATIQLAQAEVLPLNPTGWGVTFSGQPDPGRSVRACP